MAHDDRPRVDVDSPAAPEEVLAQFPEDSPAEILALAETQDPELTPSERAVGRLLADAVESELGTAGDHGATER